MGVVIFFVKDEKFRRSGTKSLDSGGAIYYAI